MCITDYEISIPDNFRDAKVKNLLDDNGNWNWTELEKWMPSYILNKLHEVFLPQEGHIEDKLIVAGTGA